MAKKRKKRRYKEILVADFVPVCQEVIDMTIRERLRARTLRQIARRRNLPDPPDHITSPEEFEAWRQEYQCTPHPTGSEVNERAYLEHLNRCGIASSSIQESIARRNLERGNQIHEELQRLGSLVAVHGQAFLIQHYPETLQQIAERCDIPIEELRGVLEGIRDCGPNHSEAMTRMAEILELNYARGPVADEIIADEAVATHNGERITIEDLEIALGSPEPELPELAVGGVIGASSRLSFIEQGIPNNIQSLWIPVENNQELEPGQIVAFNEDRTTIRLCGPEDTPLGVIMERQYRSPQNGPNQIRVRVRRIFTRTLDGVPPTSAEIEESLDNIAQFYPDPGGFMGNMGKKHKYDEKYPHKCFNPKCSGPRSSGLKYTEVLKHTLEVEKDMTEEKFKKLWKLKAVRFYCCNCLGKFDPETGKKIRIKDSFRALNPILDNFIPNRPNLSGCIHSEDGNHSLNGDMRCTNCGMTMVEIDAARSNPYASTINRAAREVAYRWGMGGGHPMMESLVHATVQVRIKSGSMPLNNLRMSSEERLFTADIGRFMSRNITQPDIRVSHSITDEDLRDEVMVHSVYSRDFQLPIVGLDRILLYEDEFPEARTPEDFQAICNIIEDIMPTIIDITNRDRFLDTLRAIPRPEGGRRHQYNGYMTRLIGIIQLHIKGKVRETLRSLNRIQ